VARLRGNLPLCHVRLSLFNWAPVRPTLDYNKSHTSIFFVMLGQPGSPGLISSVTLEFSSGEQLPFALCAFRFLCSSFSCDRREWIWRKDRFSSSKISDEGPRRVSREKSIISWCLFFLLSPFSPHPLSPSLSISIPPPSPLVLALKSLSINVYTPSFFSSIHSPISLSISSIFPFT